jgi:hypothetical protein
MRFRKSGSTKGSWDPAEMQRAVEAVMNKSMCNDHSDDDIEDVTSSRPVCRSVDANKSKDDTCIVCGEFGRDRELWYRCRVCAVWAHEACTSAVECQ